MKIANTVMTRPSSQSPLKNLRLALIPTALLVMFLFYIDEGWYNFRWMQSWGNWIVFVVYMIMLIPIFWIMTQFMFRNFSGMKKALLVSAVGIPGVCIVFLLLLSIIC